MPGILDRLKERAGALKAQIEKAAADAEARAKSAEADDAPDSDDKEGPAESSEKSRASPARRALGSGFLFIVTSLPIILRGDGEPSLFARFLFVVMAAQFFWQLHQWRLWREENG